MMPIKALLMRSAAGASPALDKAAIATAFPSSTFSTSSATYTNLLNGSGGSAISVTLQKGTGTQIWIGGAAHLTVGTSTQVVLGVNDGTTDYDLGQRAIDGIYRTVAGDILISGLAAGTYTFTLRIKVPGVTSVDFDNACSAFIRAMEVAA